MATKRLLHAQYYAWRSCVNFQSALVYCSCSDCPTTAISLTIIQLVHLLCLLAVQLCIQTLLITHKGNDN